MITDFEYAVIAASAYRTARHEDNRLAPSSKWLEIRYVPPQPSGFEAVAYRRGDEVVIAFTGSDEMTDWWSANLAMFLGAWTSEQVKEAARLTAEIMNVHGYRSRIVFAV